MSIQGLELLAFSGERKRADGRLHSDISIKVSHQSTNQNLLRDLGQKFLSTGQRLKFGDHVYQIEQFATDDNNTIRLFLSRESDVTILQRERAQEAALWSSLEEFFVGGQS